MGAAGQSGSEPKVGTVFFILAVKERRMLNAWIARAGWTAASFRAHG
jgi:hypothetical protein